MINNKAPTKTKGTKKAYLERAENLVERSNMHDSDLDELDQKGFFSWFVTQKPKWKYSTFRQYKASMVYACEVWGYDKLGSAIKKISRAGCKDSKRRIPPKERLTSAKKKKSISDKELQKVIAFLKKQGRLGYWEGVGLKFFYSSCHTGLRPCEYSRSRIRVKKDDSGQKNVYVSVENAKNTNGRSHGLFRHIGFGQMDAITRKLVVTTVKMARDPRDAHNRVITPEQHVRLASQAFSKLMCRILGRRQMRITIYTGRHQFAANLKRSGLSRAEVAALMGHGSDATAGRHYGKRRCGRVSPNAPVALKQEVNRVREKAKPCPKKIKTKGVKLKPGAKVLAFKPPKKD
jgi:integrase